MVSSSRTRRTLIDWNPSIGTPPVRKPTMSAEAKLALDNTAKDLSKSLWPLSAGRRLQETNPPCLKPMSSTDLAGLVSEQSYLDAGHGLKIDDDTVPPGQPLDHKQADHIIPQCSCNHSRAALGRRIGDNTKPTATPLDEQAASIIDSDNALEFSSDTDTMSSPGTPHVPQRVPAIASRGESTPSCYPSLPQPGSAARLPSGTAYVRSLGSSGSQEQYRRSLPPTDPINAELRHNIAQSFARAMRSNHRWSFEEANTNIAGILDNDPEAEPLRQRVMARLAECDRGEYDFGAMQQASGRGEFLDHASYLKNTKVSRAGYRGLGLFATRDLKRGDIVLVEKAVCTVDGVSTGLARHFRRLADAVIDQIGPDPCLTVQFLSLHRTPRIAESRPVLGTTLDDGRVIDIVRYNALDDLHHGQDACVDELGRHVPFTPAKSGLWLHASRMNHSCLPNTTRATIGDMLVVRATRDIRVGEEVMTNYVPIKPFQQRTESLQRWKFQCDCRLCVAERRIPREVHRELEDIDVEAKALFDLVHSLPYGDFVRRESELREQWNSIYAGLNRIEYRLAWMHTHPSRLGVEDKDNRPAYGDAADLLPRPGFRGTELLLEQIARHPRQAGSTLGGGGAVGHLDDDGGDVILSMMSEHGFPLSEKSATGTPIANWSNGIYDKAALKFAGLGVGALLKVNPFAAPSKAMLELYQELFVACHGPMDS